LDLFADRLLRGRSVMLISGKFFDCGKEYFRLGLGRRSFEEAFRIFAATVAESGPV